MKPATKQEQAEQATVQFVTRAVKNHYLNDKPPPKDVIVYPKSIVPMEEAGIWGADVKIVVDYCGIRSHKVKIKAKITKNGRLMPETLLYL